MKMVFFCGKKTNWISSEIRRHGKRIDHLCKENSCCEPENSCDVSDGYGKMSSR